MSSISRTALALLSAAALLTFGSVAEAQCLKCSESTNQSSCDVTDAWGFCCIPGFILANNSATGAASISMTMGDDSLEILQTFNSDGCCVAPYANIGIFDACQAADQYGQAGSHLPLQLKDIALLKGAWTFQVPMPLNPSASVEQYRVYFEMFLSGTAEGQADSGNITLVFFWNNYGFDDPTGHAPINGSQGLDVIDYGESGVGQGPFVDFLYPKGTYTPDSNGVITVESADVKEVLDWAQSNFPEYYNGDIWLSHLSLAEEAGAFHGTVKTTYASFAIQKAGSDVVYTPPWSSDHWDGATAGAGGAGEGVGGTSMGGSSTGGTSGSGTSAGGSSAGGSSAGRGTAGGSSAGRPSAGGAGAGAPGSSGALGQGGTGGSVATAGKGGATSAGGAPGSGGGVAAAGGAPGASTPPPSDSQSGCNCRMTDTDSTGFLGGALALAVATLLRRRRTHSA